MVAQRLWLAFRRDETAVITSAIGNHDEGTGVPVNAVALN
jgi:uncharacterized protein YecT (DUF1311 family)